MSWLDKLEKHGKQARKRKSDVTPTARAPVVQEIIVSVRPANERTGDPGEQEVPGLQRMLAGGVAGRIFSFSLHSCASFALGALGHVLAGAAEKCDHAIGSRFLKTHPKRCR